MYLQNKIVALLAWVIAACVPLSAQTYTYRMVKMVGEDGSAYSGDNHTVTITFSSGQGSFYVSDVNGNRLGSPSQTGRPTGYNNYVPIRRSGGYNINATGSYSQREVRDRQDFYFTGMTGDVIEYRSQRPILSYNDGSVTDYEYDYARFSSDYSRINLIPTYHLGPNGIMAFGCLPNYSPRPKIFVFERIQAANEGDFY